VEDFQFYVTDVRYGVRSLMLVQTADEKSACSLAKRMLTNKHYHQIEVWRDERQIFSLSDPSGLA
jgi:hypothetical protein